jgi:hypothetical protein
MSIAKRCLRFLFLGCLLLFFSAAVFAQPGDTTKAQPHDATCIECICIRVGLPRVVRGPDGTAVDNTVSEIKLPNVRFRGFTAVGTSWAIDGDKPWDMGGPAVPVLKPGGADSGWKGVGPERTLHCRSTWCGRFVVLHQPQQFAGEFVVRRRHWRRPARSIFLGCMRWI